MDNLPDGVPLQKGRREKPREPEKTFLVLKAEMFF